MAEETTLTDDIAAIRLTDFRRFDLLYDGLRHGTGLMWKGAGDNLERIMPTGRRDYFVSVSVDRDALMAHFPMQARVSLHEGSRTDEGGLNPRQEGEGPIFWDDFGSDALPELERLNDAAVRDQWWTWPEAIAWIGSRDVKNIATLRYWGQEWFGRDDGERDPTIILGAQDYMARQYCPSPRHALSELHTFIERGEIQTVGRPGRDARSCPLTKEEWRGGEIVYTGGVAVLASSSNKLTAWSFDIAVSRLDLFTAFPVSNGGCAEKVIKERKRPGPAPDKDWPHAIAKVTQDCVAAGYKRQRKRGDKSAIQTMLLNYMAEKDKHFSDDIAAKYAETVIAALPDN